MNDHLVFCLILTFFVAVMTAGYSQSNRDQATVAKTDNLLTAMEVYFDTACNKAFEEVKRHWVEYDLHSAAFPKNHFAVPLDYAGCSWTRLKFYNPDSVTQTRVLYFPKGWRDLMCYVSGTGDTFEKRKVGIYHKREVLSVNVPSRDTLTMYVAYPSWSSAYRPQLNVREFSEQEYLSYQSRNIYKFLLVGVLIFPILFFLVQFLVQKDKLSLYYLLFLLGSGIYLLTMLDTVPYFALSPKIITSADVIGRLFVIGTLLTLTGLVKYVHAFLNVFSWSISSAKVGNILLFVFLLIALMPFLYTPLFNPKNYEGYLQCFRIWALLIFLYIVWLSAWALWRNIEFSRILLLAFTPFIISGLLYAISFVIVGNFARNDWESLSLIISFILTLLLFGVVLGLRNNTVRREKLILEQRTERLKELDQFKTRFYTNITHEFRTPLTVIRGMAGQITGNEKSKKLIRRNSDRLLSMINELLDLSKLETQSLPVNWVQGDIIPYLQYLTESCHSLAVDKKQNLAFFSREESLIMDYDEIKIQQILINLISNAIKFTPEYGTVKVIAARVSENSGLALELSVKDTGKGIPPDQLPHVFDRFYQVDDSSTRPGEGSGIGLALVRELVNLLGGRIEVASEEGRGSTFLVYLPIYQKARLKEANFDLLSSAPLQPQLSGSDEKTKIATGIGDDEKPQVLIIEDNADVIEYIAFCLEQDYALQAARDGEEGVEKALETIPDVILCDVMMPKMDGFEVCRRLKSDRRTSHIPIVLLTAKATQKDKITGLSHGADAYLTKPFDKEELLIRLENLTTLSKRLQERLKDPITSGEPSEEPERREAAFLAEVDRMIEANLNNESFDTAYLCRAVAMSRTQLHRKFKALTGLPTASYIRSYRLRRAKVLLETSDLPIGDIALEVGFKDFSHFSRSFFKEFGLTPSGTRK